MRLLWILLSTNKCNGVPFTDISEWKRHSSSSGSTDSSHWIVLFTTVAVRYTSMMCLFSIFYGWYSQSEFASMALTSTTNDYFDWHSSVLFQGILWKSHHFPVSFFIFPLPFLSCVLYCLSRDYLLRSYLSFFGCCRLGHLNSHLFWWLKFFSILTTYR